VLHAVRWCCGCRQALSDPEYVRRSLDPANVQAIVQMQQAMQQLQSSGLMPALGGGPAALAPASTGATRTSVLLQASPKPAILMLYWARFVIFLTVVAVRIDVR
jgi:hypothetical protein